MTYFAPWGGGDVAGYLRYDDFVFTDMPGVLVFAVDPSGKPTVVVVPDKVTATDMVKCLEEEGWEILEPSFDFEVTLDDEDEDDDPEDGDDEDEDDEFF